MFNSSELSDISILLGYLQEIYPKSVQTMEDLEAKVPYRVNKKTLFRDLYYCQEKGFIEAHRIEESGVTVGFANIRITAAGIDINRKA